jgi:23S rRNA (guanosine2251-2'-O)-methyltransferase
MSRIFGTHAIADVFRTTPKAIGTIYVSAEHLRPEEETLLEEARAAGIPIEQVNNAQQRQRSGGRGGGRISADIRLAGGVQLEDLVSREGQKLLVVVLDGVTDPHNLGAILRSSAVYGVDAIVVPKDRSAPLNDAAFRSSAGGAVLVPIIRVPNLARALRQLKKQGMWVFGAMANGEQSLYDYDLNIPLTVVLGSEGKGIRPGVLKACDGTLNLPMVGPLDSLNVSVAAGVILSEITRQRIL